MTSLSSNDISPIAIPTTMTSKGSMITYACHVKKYNKCITQSSYNSVVGWVSTYTLRLFNTGGYDIVPSNTYGTTEIDISNCDYIMILPNGVVDTSYFYFSN